MVKHRLAGSVKHRFISVNFFMRVITPDVNKSLLLIHAMQPDLNPQPLSL